MASTAAKSASIPSYPYEVGTDIEECLYTAFRTVNGTLQSITNETVQGLVADYLYTRDISESKRLKTPQKYKSAKDCYNEVKEGKLRGGENEWKALARVSKLVIRVIWKKMNGEDDDSVQVFEYGEDDTSVEECVYLLYNRETKLYKPLYVHDKTSNDRITIFERDDQRIPQLFAEFIRKKSTDHVDDEQNSQGVQETSSSVEASDPAADLNRLVVMKCTTTDAGFSYSKAVDPESSLSNKQVINESRKRAKVDEEDEVPCKRKNLSIEAVKQSSCNDPGAIVIEIPVPSLNNERMRFEVEPTLRFRGRTPGDFKPETRLRRYFADRNGRTFLYLLIPEKFLSLDGEYRVEIYLITREIDGVSYVQPYFKFQGNASDPAKLDENPKYVTFTMNDLQNHSEGMKKLLLQLVVVQRTNPQLMEAHQPLEIFSSENGATPITTIYTDKHLFKDAFHLHDLRFAVTLFKKQPGEGNFGRCDDIQCISQISTEDKKYKIGVQTNQQHH